MCTQAGTGKSSGNPHVVCRVLQLPGARHGDGERGRGTESEARDALAIVRSMHVSVALLLVSPGSLEVAVRQEHIRSLSLNLGCALTSSPLSLDTSVPMLTMGLDRPRVCPFLFLFLFRLFPKRARHEWTVG